MAQTLTYEELRQRAAAAVEASARSQSELAGDLGLHKSTVSRALNEAGGKHQSTQIRIVEHLTSYQVERQVRFVLREEA